MNSRNRSGKRLWLIIAIIPVFLGVVLLSIFAARFSTGATSPYVAKRSSTPLPTPSPTFTPTPTPSPTPTLTLLPMVRDTGQILGIEGNPKINYKGIPWVRLGYPSCGWGNLRGSVLKQTIE